MNIDENARTKKVQILQKRREDNSTKPSSKPRTQCKHIFIVALKHPTRWPFDGLFVFMT